jgi:hypothetical protein
MTRKLVLHYIWKKEHWNLWDRLKPKEREEIEKNKENRDNWNAMTKFRKLYDKAYK